MCTYIAIGAIVIVIGIVGHVMYQQRKQPLWRVDYSGEFCEDFDAANSMPSYERAEGTIYIRAVNIEIACIEGRSRINLGEYCYWSREPKLTISLISE